MQVNPERALSDTGHLGSAWSICLVMNYNFRYILEEPLISIDGLELLASIIELPIDEAEKLTDDEMFEEYESLDLMP